MAKKEIGEVSSVLKGSGASEYQVRLGRGEVIIVPHALVRPGRMTLLARGSHLLITHTLGRVEAASTDLKYALPGKVSGARGGVYQVELDQGGLASLAKDKVQPHPVSRGLLPGAQVEVLFNDREVLEASLVREFDRATAHKIQIDQKTVSLQGEHGDHFTVRLDPSVLRQIQIGEKFEIEINYSPDGKRKIAIQRLTGSTPAARPEKESPARPAKPGPTSTDQRRPSAEPRPSKGPEPRTGYDWSGQSSTRQPANPARVIQETARSAPPSQVIVTEAVGLDPTELERVRREGHRFEIVSFLQKHARDELIEWYRLKPGRTPRYAQPKTPLQPQIQRAVRAALPEFRDFFQHQASALDSIRAGRNLVIVTQTASGKTLSYNPAVFEYLSAHPQGHVLYVFPLNALMLDQVEKINSLVEALGRDGLRVTAAHLKGGMTAQDRDAIARACPNIVATNPEMLSYLLGLADRDWRNFFAGLKYVIIDEVHSYRGIFGVHMTGIVRRLLFTSRRLGGDPHFILSSATVNNPKDLAARLTSLPQDDFDLLDADQDGSQQADKHWLVLNPDWGSRSAKYANYQEVAADVFVEMLTTRGAGGKESPLNTILFCRSIREVKTIGRLVEQRLSQRAPHLKNKVKSYVAAELVVEAKREIYEGLRSGRYLGVISTNALEAGIDIGRLDACIIAGFPFSVMALRQMAGRVGRKEEGLVLFIPFPLSSLDEYYRDHPDLLLEQPPEEFVVDPQNPYIARKHINAAAQPAGIRESELRAYWGERALEMVRQARLDGVMRQTGERWFGTRRDYRAADDVYNISNIRSNIQRPYAICTENGAACTLGPACLEQNGKGCPNRVTLLDQQYVYRDCHPGAVYEFTDRRLFRVLGVDDEKRVVRVKELPEETRERTYVEGDVQIELRKEPRARKSLAPGVDLAWGEVTVTRLFTGYFEYQLEPARRCRRCRREFDDLIDTCPNCGRPAERYYRPTRPERQDFPAPYQQGFRIVLNTIACWLSLRPEIETSLDSCSPCRLPGEQNRVLAWLKRPLNLDLLPARLRLSEEEKAWLREYHQKASESLDQAIPTAHETLLFPGIYGQCLMSELRKHVPEGRALELFQVLSGYPVTDDLRHICRKCQRSVLMPAMHTLEHAVDARYPSVALGDRSDIGAFTTLGHAATGSPSIFWFDNYEGGLGAAEKIYELIPRLLQTGLDAIQSCTCSTIEGCPRCTYIPDCSEGNDDLSKPAGVLLLARLLGQESLAVTYAPFLYRRKRAADFDKAYKDNQTAPAAHGMGEEAPAETALDPYQLLRLQRQVHAVVVDKAFEARSREIVDEPAPVSASQLNQAYQSVIHGNLLNDWPLRPTASPYEVLEVLPAASLKMIQQIYRAIALQIHPDANPDRAAWANECMKQVNAAYEKVLREKNYKYG